jgi:ribosome-associated toxin RatA of RatAB toxin-antitoxin module
MSLVDGPFRRLAGHWQFRPLRVDACKVHLQLHYDFAPGLLGRAIAPVFDGIASSLIDSFTRRAEAMHEPR